MTLTVQPVGVEYANQTWPLVERFIADAMERGGQFPDWASNYTVAQIQTFVTSGAWLLLVAVDAENDIYGACTVSFINYPLHRVAFITAAGGVMITDASVMQQLSQVLRAHGATKIQAYVRPAMLRLLRRRGFQPRNTLAELKI